MTPQQAFTKMVNHLRKQNAECRHSRGECVFRNDEGMACAIGCLIPDDEYHVGMEGQAAWALRTFSGWPIETGRVMADMQRTHDGYAVSQWEDRFALVAGSHGLKLPEVTP